MTPIATYDGKIVAYNLLKGNHLKPNYIGVPSVVFTIPPLASVGLQESVAKEQGIHFKTNFQKNTSGWYTSRRIGESYSGFKVLVEQRSIRDIRLDNIRPSIKIKGINTNRRRRRRTTFYPQFIRRQPWCG